MEGMMSPCRSVAAAVLAALVLAGCSGKAKPGPTVTAAGPTVSATVTATATATTTATPTVIKTISTVTKVKTVTFTPPVVVAFSDGTRLVPSEIKPGIYKTAGSPGRSCYYSRFGDLSGDDIIANDISEGPMVMEVAASDKSVKTSGGCDWVKAG